jgi:hypothetical protein
MFVRKPAFSVADPETYLLMDDKKTIHELKKNKRKWYEPEGWYEPKGLKSKLEAVRTIDISKLEKVKVDASSEFAQVFVKEKMMYFDKKAIRLLDQADKNTARWQHGDLDDDYVEANGTHGLYKWDEDTGLATLKNFAEESSVDCLQAGAGFATFIGNGLRLIRYGLHFCIFDLQSRWKGNV